MMDCKGFLEYCGGYERAFALRRSVKLAAIVFTFIDDLVHKVQYLYILYRIV